MTEPAPSLAQNCSGPPESIDQAIKRFTAEGEALQLREPHNCEPIVIKIDPPTLAFLEQHMKK